MQAIKFNAARIGRGNYMDTERETVIARDAWGLEHEEADAVRGDS